MTTTELNAELLRELSTIATDEGLLRKAIKAIKAIKRQNNRMTDGSAEDAIVDDARCYTTEQMKQRAIEAMEAYKRGECIPNEEVMKQSMTWI